MTDQEFDKLLADALMDAAWQRWADVMEGQEELEWTPRRRKNIEKLLREPRLYAKRWFRPKWKKVLITAASLLLIVSTIFGGVIAVNPDARAWVQRVIQVWTESFTSFYFTGNEKNDTNMIWRLGYLAEGYVEVSMDISNDIYRTTYKNEKGALLYFSTRLVLQGNGIDLDNEHYIYKETTLNGQPAYMYEAYNHEWPNSFIWFDETGTTSFQLTGNVNSQELLLMAESVFSEQKK